MTTATSQKGPGLKSESVSQDRLSWNGLGSTRIYWAPVVRLPRAGPWGCPGWMRAGLRPGGSPGPVGETGQ